MRRSCRELSTISATAKPELPEDQLGTAYDLAIHGIEHQPELLGDLRTRAAALLGAGLVVGTLFAPVAFDAHTKTIADWFFGAAGLALFLGLVLSWRVFAQLSDGGSKGYDADVKLYVEKRSRNEKIDDAEKWVDAFSHIERKWRVTFNEGVLLELNKIDTSSPPLRELVRFIDFTRVRNWHYLQKKALCFSVSIPCFSLELVFGLVGLAVK